ncbi:MAG: hypothetical protein CMJ48_00110 [Planctomycetaceae bacterium]|nr:hypothetical protein [Planctomycetaceae bacterium]
MSDLTRRGFISRSTTASLALGAGFSLATSVGAADKKSESAKANPTICAFTKSFQDRPIPEVCRMFKQIGLDGLDLTVRPKGHIEPENVKAELPKAAAAAKQAGVEIVQLTTGIVEADRNAENMLAVCREIGVKKIKLGYFRYKEFGSLANQLDETRRTIATIAKLAGKYGVLPCLHVHSGTFLPSHGTQAYQLVKDFSPTEVGAYVDMLHMVLEGGRDGWRQGLDLLGPWISLCAVKNFIFEQGERDRHGQLRWHSRLVPVSEGVSPIPDFVAALKKLDYKGPYSLHSEYKGRHSFKDMTTDECLQQTKTDLDFFKPLVQA